MLRSISELVRNLNSSSLPTSGVKQGDNLAPALFIFAIHAVSNSLDKKWEFETPDLRWYPDTQPGKPRGQLRGTNHSNKGTKFSFFTAFILLNRGELAGRRRLPPRSRNAYRSGRTHFMGNHLRDRARPSALLARHRKAPTQGLPQIPSIRSHVRPPCSAACAPIRRPP
jgi:hypothetical protein